MTPALEVNDLTVSYGEAPVLWDLDLKIPTGILGAIVGPNGAGKSTLIKAVVGLVRPEAGEVSVFGQPAARMHRSIAYVPQRNAVDWDFPTTVFDTVLMGTYPSLGWFRRPGNVERAKAHAAIERVGLADYLRRPIGELSGGQQQRCFLARALVQEAPLLLMDEPFQGVDAKTERSIVDILRELRDRGTTILVVHHDLATLGTYFEWMALLRVSLVAAGPVSEVNTAEHLQRAYDHSSVPTLATQVGKSSAPTGALSASSHNQSSAKGYTP